MIPLPIDPLVPEIVAHLKRSPNLVIEAPPGAGKTTRVPPALLGLAPGEVLVLEPRRLAARLAARRVAAERGEDLGATVGYQVRFEDISGPATRLRFMTEGVFTRRILADPGLASVNAAVLDEFHERHLDGDLALALLRQLQQTRRPDLRIIVMSATLDTAPVARFLGDCAVLRSEGKLFDLHVQHSPVSPDPLENQVASALERLLRDGLDGNVLVFLPGSREIRRALRSCEPLAKRAGLLLAPLHGDLPSEEQDRAIQSADRRKIILSTNVAESSVTIEGVSAVIDSGLARVPVHSVWSGLPSLAVTRVSQASAKQRAGRAARTRPGRVIRLYPAEDFHRRPEQQLPEIARLDLSQTCLTLHGLGITRLSDLSWIDPPPGPAVQAAEELLRRLGALDAGGALTETGRRMLDFPLHPRLARLVVEAERRGASSDGCAVAALLSTGERLPDQYEIAGPSDLLALLEQKWTPDTKRVLAQLRQIASTPKRRKIVSGPERDEVLLISVLTAFPDRVAKRADAGGRGINNPKSSGKKTTTQRDAAFLLLSGGGGAVLSPASVVRDSELLIAVDAEDRPEHGAPLVRLASAIQPKWLIDLFPERMTERKHTNWNRSAERVESVSALVYDDLVIEETRGGVVDPGEAARLLAEKAWEAGIARFADIDEVTGFLDRIAFASQHAAVPQVGDSQLKDALEAFCLGLRSFADLQAAAKSGGFLRTLEDRLPRDAMRLIDQVAPAFVRLPGGRRAKVHYSKDKPPWLASRLQDFFGMKETPRVARGAVPLVLHLLAPNQRPVQTTTDLAGFWERLYPETRRQLSRRYPKHRWPEDPLSA
jgi:ATP-dependent helicase HrpB